ncbi:MAG: hypothetical protein OEZ65_02220 [Gemmatimonadota bacterium]|nr:hypothetical protein [Gemmatimonadota bacterium]MDH5758376.1 hypothetical protein [Gemmatimonadota bacterium]
MKRFWGPLGVLLVVAAAMGFATLNGSTEVTLRLGIMTLYRVPLTVVTFGALLVGMVIMLVSSVASDLKVRGILRDRLAQEAMEEEARFVDLAQHDLFQEGKEAE